MDHKTEKEMWEEERDLALQETESLSKWAPFQDRVKVSKTIKLTAEEQEFLGQHLDRVISELMVPPAIKGDLSSEFLYAHNKHLKKLKKIY